MSVELHEELDGKILVLNLRGKLTKEDYNLFTPEVEKAVEKHDKVRMLVRMQDFHGWTTSALWEDIKFDLRHFADIDRLALVGDKPRKSAISTRAKMMRRPCGFTKGLNNLLQVHEADYGTFMSPIGGKE
jgi:hypothetical protein